MFEQIVMLFVSMPILAVVWFVWNLVSYLKAPKESEKRNEQKGKLILSAVVAGVLIFVIISIIALFYLAILNM